jgi:hypothetical protein
MKIYRVEDVNGDGPYNGRNSISFMQLMMAGYADSMEAWNDHAPRYELPIWASLDREDSRKFLFGFSSLDKLKIWFDARMRALYAGRGFLIAIYEVANPDVVECSTAQCVFPEDAKRVGALDLRDFHEIAITKNKPSISVDKHRERI